MSQIGINHLTFSYEGSYDEIFKDVSFTIDTDWKLGFIGRNGKGKTTFLKLLMGQYEYRGSITTDAEFAYFPYTVEREEEDTVQVIEEISPSYELWKVIKELNLLKVDADVLYRPFSTLSHGERTKVMLAVLFSGNHPFLLIDEPTNHLDAQAREVLGAYLNKKKGFLLVSHDRVFLDSCVDHILALNRANITVMKGNFSTWMEEKNKEDLRELSQNENLKKEIRKKKEAAARVEGWAGEAEKEKHVRIAGLRPDRGFMGHKAAKIMKRSKIIETRVSEAIEEKEGLLKNLERTEDLKLYPLKYHKRVLVRMQDVTVAYGEKKIVEDFRLTLEEGERVALLGRNGCGKSSILKIITGEIEACQGLAEIPRGLILSLVPQNTAFLKGELQEFIKASGVEETLFKSLLRKLDFSRTQFDKRLEDFSEGQRKKVLIARSLCQRAHLYLWDEPLNYIDLFSRMQIENLLLEFRPTLLMVEHDRSFVEKVATRCIEMDL